MKSLIIYGIFILHCCVLSSHCFPIKEELSFGLSKNNREMPEMEKTDGYDPDCDLKLDEVDIGETKKEQFPDIKIKAEIVSKNYPSLKAKSKTNAAEQLIKGVLHPMEQLATTASPVTEFPHGYLYPGTKWCGRGNIATSDDDLGTEEEADKCCRHHDHCPDHILPGKTKYNLTNHSSYTGMACKCDQTFYECLRRANTTAANAVGSIYFNLGAQDCFGLDYPRKCIKTVPIFKFCYEYEIDISAEKIYQWIPAKKYKKL